MIGEAIEENHIIRKKIHTKYWPCFAAFKKNIKNEIDEI